MVSGVSIPAYWFSTYIWDLAKYILPAVICPLLILAFNLESFTSDGDVYAAVWILFLLFGLSIGPYTYCQSFLFKSYSMAQFAVFMFNLVEGGVLPLVVWVLRIINSNTRDVADVI